MDADKSILEKFADTIKAAAEAIVHPTAGTPMKMPLNESGYAITHLKRSTTAKAPGKKAVKPSGRKPPKAAKKSARKSTAKQRAAKPRKSAAKTAGSRPARKAAAKKKAGKSRR
jgi:1,4-alpha-glucan branching enzyme